MTRQRANPRWRIVDQPEFCMASDLSLETTIDLVDRSRIGDAAARNRLIQRYLPLLTRWAHGRLPHSARRLASV
jgi:RNA polymerase sigma-70 factor (ECF subfamily)